MGEEFLSALGLIIVFVLVIAGAYLVTKWVGKRYSFQGGTAKNIKVLDKVALGPDRLLVIVETAGKTMLLGVTPQHIEKICDIDPEELVPPGQESGSSFSTALKKAMKDGWGIGGKSKGKEGPHE